VRAGSVCDVLGAPAVGRALVYHAGSAEMAVREGSR
jgi:hypothetical protein